MSLYCSSYALSLGLQIGVVVHVVFKSLEAEFISSRHRQKTEFFSVFAGFLGQINSNFEKGKFH